MTSENFNYYNYHLKKTIYLYQCNIFGILFSTQFNIKGYNLVYKNRTTATRGGVAIYINEKYNFIQRDDLAINTPCIFESIFIEIQSNRYNVIVG